MASTMHDNNATELESRDSRSRRGCLVNVDRPDSVGCGSWLWGFARFWSFLVLVLWLLVFGFCTRSKFGLCMWFRVWISAPPESATAVAGVLVHDHLRWCLPVPRCPCNTSHTAHSTPVQHILELLQYVSSQRGWELVARTYTSGLSLRTALERNPG